MFLLLSGGLQEKVSILSNTTPSRDLMDSLVGSQRLNDEMRRKVSQLKDLLDKMFVLDHTKRISINQCLMHPFITEKIH